MKEAKRTPGQAEGTEEDVQNALNKDQQKQQRSAAQPGEALEREAGRTPGQAEGTEEQADGSLRHQNE